MRALPISILSIVIGSLLGATSAYWSIGPQRSADDIQAIRGTSGESQLKFPHFVVDKAEYGFGSMQRGTSRSHVFKVKNTGDAPMVLSVASTTCKCTGCDIGDGVVPPGESQDVKLDWVAKSDPGDFRQTATIETNDPRARRVELTVEGKVTTLSGLEPEEFFFSGIRPGDKKIDSVFLMSFTDESFEIQSTRLESPDMEKRFSVTTTKVDVADLPNASAKSGYRIDVMPKDGLPLGPIHDWVLVQTNQHEDSEFRIPIQGSVRGDIEIRGPGQWNDITSSVHLGDIMSQEGAEVKLFLYVTGEHAKDTTFEVSEVDPPTLEVELGEPKVLRDDLAHVPLIVRVPKGSPPEIRNGSGLGEPGRVVIKTNHPLNPEISFGVRYVIKRQSVTK